MATVWRLHGLLFGVRGSRGLNKSGLCHNKARSRGNLNGMYATRPQLVVSVSFSVGILFASTN